MTRSVPALVGSLLVAAILVSCTHSESPATTQPSPPEEGLNSITADNLHRHISRLASDEFEGRLPGTKGEELTVNYIVDQFKALGLKPGNTDGTYVQTVPLVGLTADPNMSLTFRAGTKKVSLRYGDEFVAWTKRVVETSGLQDSDVVFVGYGIVAPEFDWDDYKGLDVRDKTLVMLINDPPLPDPRDPSKLDETMFGGKAMTYYGRWTYKFEIAAQKGAKGCFIIHETKPAAYPWGVVQGSWTGEQFDLVTPDKNRRRCAVEGWLSYESAKRLFRLAGQNLEAWKKAALRRDFRPLPLNAKASVSLKNSLRRVDSANVLARLEGSDPKLKNQYVIYVAHWDHLGKDPTLAGDQIFNGAVDNATGVAGLLELAEGFAKLPKPPRRSLLFMAVTAEEQGLLGSRYYAENPIYPLTQTVAVVNLDAMNPWGRTKDVIILGMGNSTLDEVVQAVAREQGRTVRPDPEPEKGLFYRSDHFNFAKQGVPALYLDGGIEYVGRPQGWGLQMMDKFTQQDYHKPSDEIKPEWDLSGLAEDVRLLFQVGYRVANEDKYPEWKPGTEFKTKREQMLKSNQP